MFRKIGIASLIGAFVAATTPGYACTGISLKAADGAAIRGRTLEFGFPMQSNVLVVPAGQELAGTLPDGGKGLVYTSRYAFAGANALGLPAILDGLNDQGLSVGLFYFPTYASYTAVTPENAKHALAPQEFGTWVLANFASVDEVKAALKDIVLVPTPVPGLGSPKGAVAGAHFFIQDKSGKSIAVEPVDGTLKVHDAPLGVMTNAPTYDWHMTNLNNYLSLTVKDIDSTKLGPVTLSAFGSGSGLHGLPGDFTPPSRFIRAAVYSQAAAPNATADDAVFAAFHILNQFDIPKGCGGERGHRQAGRRGDGMDFRRRPQKSALVLPDPRGPIDPYGGFETGRRCRQGRDADDQDGGRRATRHQCLLDLHERQGRQRRGVGAQSPRHRSGLTRRSTGRLCRSLLSFALPLGGRAREEFHAMSSRKHEMTKEHAVERAMRVLLGETSVCLRPSAGPPRNVPRRSEQIRPKARQAQAALTPVQRMRGAAKDVAGLAHHVLLDLALRQPRVVR